MASVGSAMESQLGVGYVSARQLRLPCLACWR